MSFCVDWAMKFLSYRGGVAATAFDVAWEDNDKNNTIVWGQRLQAWKETKEFQEALPSTYRVWNSHYGSNGKD